MSGHPGAEERATATGADGAPSSRWWRFGRRTTTSTVIVLVVLVLLAAALGLGTAKAIASLSDGTSSGTVGGTTPVGGTGNTGASSTATAVSDGANTEESGAPIILQGGGAQPGFGAYNTISCGDTIHCIAAGADGAGHGVIGTTLDGGSTWQNDTVPAGTPPMIATACASSSHCVAVGQGAILISSTAGRSWTMQPPPTAKTTLFGVRCPSTALCLSVGAGVNPTAGPYSGEVLRSTDEGSTWSVDALPVGTMAMADVTCPSATRCIAVGGGILTSDDAGVTWQIGTVPGGTGVLRSISCSSALVCVAVGPNPLGADESNRAAFAIMTSDGGTTWSNVTMPAATASIEGVTCAPSGPCYAVGPNPAGSLSAMLASSDGGSTWSPASLPGGLTSISGLACPAVSTCISVGRAGQASAVARTVSGVTSVATLPVVAP